MNIRKNHSSGEGIVATDNLDTIFKREIFFPVDPATLDHIDYQEFRDCMPSGVDLEVQPEKFLSFLPELEAEIFWLIHERKKNQKDVAELLHLSQPTVSYRYRRTLDKLAYIMTLTSLDIRGMIKDMSFLKQHEQDILYDLFFFVNQELVGKKYHVRQSSVKWIFVKAKRRVEALERTDETWSHHFGMMLFLEKNLGVRVLM